ncbi:hypothetical protein DL89DRAFT_260411 [Linderina pennispora]|uniref:Uncharacterized protein n=1 Tax=Linderina pennispora TaxID=61395 RepID=A0A1Y1VYK2_9FUNG|nr:uncharacterized protein DL89DRAFT_260411 [Linderina pennispora]ORX66115.1 hypothetical protein DL89DRAFT_260411 [Linderina pennispora]
MYYPDDSSSGSSYGSDMDASRPSTAAHIPAARSAQSVDLDDRLRSLPDNRSLPNIKIKVKDRSRNRLKYAGQGYTGSYSSHDDSDGSVCDNPSVNEIVYRRAPALSKRMIGAARLSEMMYGRRRHRAAEEAAMAEERRKQAELRLLEEGKRKRKKRHRRQLNVIRTGIDGDLQTSQTMEQSAMPAADGLALDNKELPEKQILQEQIADKPKQLLSTSDGGPESEFNLRMSFASDMDSDEEFNGLLAPGAFGDEKQKELADGNKFRRILGAKAHEREARLFKPVVFDPNRGNAANGASWAQNDQGGEGFKFPFCCCGAKYCVAATFAMIVLLSIVGFFLWPRVPSISISSLSALEPAKITYDKQESLFGIMMPLQINYAINSGNFYPLVISRVHVLGFNGVTGNRIIETEILRLESLPQTLQFHSANTTMHYLTSDMSDPALVDLFAKCAPKSSGLQSSDLERSGKLSIRFHIKVDVGNFGWLKQPVVTLNQQVECPE